MKLIDAKVLDIPKGLKATRYAVFNAEETDGVGLIFEDGSPQFPVSHYKDYAKQPITLQPKKDNFYYYSVKIVVTGEISGKATSCRFTYEQKNAKHWQDVPCSFTLGLGK